MKSIGSCSRIISWHGPIGLGKAPVIISGGTFTFIIKRRGTKLLPETSQPDIGQAFDSFKKIVNPRLSVSFQTKVLPEFVDIEKRTRFSIEQIFCFNEFAHNSCITLITCHGLY